MTSLLPLTFLAALRVSRRKDEHVVRKDLFDDALAQDRRKRS